MKIIFLISPKRLLIPTELYQKWKSRPRRTFDYTEMDQFLSSHDVHNNNIVDDTGSSIFDDAGIAHV